MIGRPASGWVIMIAGRVRSGKSTLARHLAARYDGLRVGFGDLVRQRTSLLGLPGERRFWQQVGEQWVTADSAGLCDAAMAPAEGSPIVIVDGVRHEHIYRMLKARAAGRRPVLIFVDTAMEVCRFRLASDGVTEEVIDEVLGHSTESELPLLRRSADFVVDGTRDAAEALVVLDDLIGGAGQNSR